MTGEATHWMLDQGIKVVGIDAITFDPPVWAMFERKQFWEAHRVMLEREYYHLENMTNLDQLPPHGFKLSVFPDQVGQHHRGAGARRGDHRVGGGCRSRQARVYCSSFQIETPSL